MTAQDVTNATFDALSPLQREVLSLIAIGNDRGHPAATLLALERRGLIQAHTERYGTGLSEGPPVTVTRWEVPLPVHIAWCQWCTDQEIPDDESQEEKS